MHVQNRVDILYTRMILYIDSKYCIICVTSTKYINWWVLRYCSIKYVQVYCKSY